MNKLLLTAYGFSTPSIKYAAQKMIRENKVTKACIISTSWPKEKEKHPQMQQIRKELRNMNIQQVDFLDVEFEDANKLFDYDLVFLNGGYPFYLLHFIKKSGADYILRKIYQNGKLIFGLSAGSIVMGPSINLMQYLYPEDNLFDDKDLTALNLTHLQVYPHFKEMLTRDAAIKDKITEYENKTGIPIERLNNNQALEVDNGMQIFLG
ncbi:Type 1 glutamine amidotransferase-like domain-containing protein [Leuconostoc falkenbergense]|uniref:Type 1 glutamine amidotransferase-like domain-containing protein n=1 Tax=Leuconostoc falkenbergense TaxID=2766470 RepID=UPI0024ADC288|nr:Type 1 glutamine amidotransferase-like domain-containing protein [Leuconostoc falkenbergense]MDI6666598.1 Type 1 glutamine amidotransferase-like domain-containing protein [Leuconostoc falkenbergense]